MRLVCLVNGWLGWQVLAWLRKNREEIVAVVLNPSGRRKYECEILEEIPADACILQAESLRSGEGLKQLSSLSPDLGISILFGCLLPDQVLDLFGHGCINLHPSLLPYNRGAYPNVWSIVDKTPSGASLHYIDSGIDTGDLIDQVEIAHSITDTGESMYRKLEETALSLFQEAWPSIKSRTNQRKPQAPGGTYHSVKDVQSIDEIFLEKYYKAEELLNILRARTFPPHQGAYFRYRGGKIYLRLELYEEQESSAE